MRVLAVAVLALLAPAGAVAAGPEAAAKASQQASAQAYLATIHAPAAANCAGAVVAVVDSGVDAANPALRGSVLPGWNVLDGTADTADTAGHGTMVAGLIAAHPVRGVAAAGVCRSARILPVVVWSSRQKPTDATISAGINWAADHGAGVINLSLGGSKPSALIEHAIDQALARNVVVVAAAGNAFTGDAQYPAAYPGVLAVAATDAQGHRPAFSSFGPWVGVAAPGTQMRTTSGTSVAVSDGTSFSAPLVSAAAALLRTRHPDWTQAQVVQRIEQTADDAGPVGVDPFFGHGILDLAAAAGDAAPRHAAGGADVNALPAGARALVLGRTLHASFAIEGGAAWYAIDVRRPAELAIAATPAADEVNGLFRRTSLAVDAYGPGLAQLASRDARWDGKSGGLELSVPAAAPGRYYLRVANAYGSLGDYSLRVRTTPLSPWAAWQESYTGSEANAVATGDVNGDGRTDVVLASSPYFSPTYANQLLLFTQQSDGTLSAPTILPRATRLCCGDVAVGDLNGDGASDVVATLGVDGIEELLQQDGKLAAPTLVPTTSAAETVAFMGSELVVGEADGLHLLNGTKDTLLDRTSPLALRVADVNGDGRPDVVATESKQPSVVVYLQRADGSFARDAVRVPRSPSGPLAVGDLNGDGRADVAVSVTGGAEVLYGLRRAVFVRAPSSPVAIADLNGDGRADLAVGNTVFMQRRDGTLSAAEGDGCPQRGYGADTLAVADVNGDGHADLVWAGSYGLVTVPRRSAWTAPPAWVEAASPAPNAAAVAVTTVPAVRFARALDPASVDAKSVQLLDGHGNPVDATVAYDAATRTVTVQPAARLAAGAAYEVTVGGVRDTSGVTLAVPFSAGFLTSR